MAAQASTDAGQSGDLSLICAAQAGDMSAFEALYSRYARAVHGVLLARLPASEVDDQVQEVFLTALRKLKKLREPAAFPGWLMTIARNRATDYHRSKRSVEELDDSAAATTAEPGSRVDALHVLAALRSLPDAYRETLTLRLVEGLTGPEIADRTGLTHGSVRVNLHRGMQMLRELLEKGQ